MSKSRRWLLSAGLVVSVLAMQGRVALADIEDSSGTNVQDGENESNATQGGSADSGDAVGGQAAGIVSSGESSVDAKNRSEDVDVESGGTTGSNVSSNFTGLNTSGDTTVTATDITETCDVLAGVTQGCTNLQDGDNESSLTQSAVASSGDAVGGQVIGAVTSAGGSADIVAANDSEDVDVESGTADATNDVSAFVGLTTTNGD